MKNQFALILFLSAQSAIAQERFAVQWNCSNGSSGTQFVDQAATGSPTITLNSPDEFAACTDRIRVFPVDLITTLKRLSILPGNASQPFLVIIGSSIFPNPDSSPFPFDGNWRGMSVGSAPNGTVFYGAITGDLLGTIGGVNKIARFDCDGTIFGNIFATEGINNRGAVIQAGSIASSSRIEINRIESIDSDSDLQALIEADVITTRISANGNQGSGVIEASQINGVIEFDGTLNRVVSSGTGSFVKAEISANAFGTTGIDTASLDASSFQNSVFVATDVRSPIEIREEWTTDTRRISIGRSLNERTDPTDALPVGNRMIILHDTDTLDGETTNPLANQVIINANNNTPTQDLNGDGLINTADFWRGDVSIDFPGQSNLGPDRFAPALDETLIGPDQPAPFQAPYYKALSHTFGRGAVGLAPFNFHQFTGPAPADRDELDCNPHHLESFQVGDCGDLPSLNQVVIDHYGPIYAVPGTAPHFRVEFLTAIQPLPNGTPWADVTHLFTIDTNQTSQSVASTNRRAVLISSGENKSGFNAAGIFRIRPIDGRVKCAGVANNPNVAYDSNVVSGDLGSTTTQQYDWYQFEVGFVTCPSESLFQGGQVASTDLAAWLDEPFEVNMDGETCPQDFNMMVDAYQP